MNACRQLAELRASRDIYLRFLTDCETRHGAPHWTDPGDSLRERVLGSLGHLRDILADIDRSIASLEAGRKA